MEVSREPSFQAWQLGKAGAGKISQDIIAAKEQLRYNSEKLGIDVSQEGADDSEGRPPEDPKDAGPHQFPDPGLPQGPGLEFDGGHDEPVLPENSPQNDSEVPTVLHRL